MEYAFVHNDTGYTPSGKMILASKRVPSHNAECEAKELAAIEAGSPVVVFPQHDKRPGDSVNMNPLAGAGVTLWTGVRVGTIVKVRTFRNPFGGTLTAYTWRDQYDKKWHGRGA